MEIRFHLDEHVHGAIANGLALRGIGVTTTADAGLLGARDQEHLALALAEHRVIVTGDDDYLRLHSQGVAHAGIAYYQPRSRTIGQVVHGLVRLWRSRTAEDMIGQIEFL
jgi:hypothetical protein